VEIAKPVKIGQNGPSESRRALCVAKVQVDPKAQPLIERIECRLQIDHDYVARLTLRSTGRQDETITEFHDLEFGLALPQGDSASGGDGSSDLSAFGSQKSQPKGFIASNLFQRSNIVLRKDDVIDQSVLWRFVPGDLVANWRPWYFDTRYQDATSRQMEERNFYIPCARCGRLESQIKAQGPIEGCRGSCEAKV
jgi:molecular chaperone DnaK